MQKRNFSAILVVALLLGLSLAATCAAKPAKNSAAKTRVADEQQIKQIVLKFLGFPVTGVKDKGKSSEERVRFDPIKIAGVWASPSFVIVDKRGKEWPYDAGLLLRKTKGRWMWVMQFYGGMISPKKAKQLGLTPSTAKKLGIRLENNIS